MISSWLYRKLLKKSQHEGFESIFVKMVNEVQNAYPYAKMHLNPFVLYRLFKKSRHQSQSLPSWSNDHH